MNSDVERKSVIKILTENALECLAFIGDYKGIGTACLDILTKILTKIGNVIQTEIGGKIEDISEKCDICGTGECDLGENIWRDEEK